MTLSTGADWINYDRWNSALAEEFFTGRFGGRPVYLDLEDDVLARVAEVAGASSVDPRECLLDVIKPTLFVLPRLSIFRAHRRRLATWRGRGEDDPPPVIAVLAFLSLVAESMATDEEFRASNYYGRFLRTLGYDAEDERLRQKVVRCFADESHVLWNALNTWLADASEVRGRPTAYAFDYRIHVGLPMSQALVRDTDRNGLREMFLDFRLPPGQQIAHADMVRLLAEWLPQSPLSRTLKHLCQHQEALERVADVACIELEAWQGESGPAGAGSRHRLSFVASMRRHPRPRFQLGLAVRLGTRSARQLELEDPGPAALAALSHSNGHMELSEPDLDGWADVTNAPSISLADALVAVLSLRGADIKIKRIPRRLVVLERDDERRRYVEVDRVRLGGEYMLLAAETLGSLLDDALHEAARPGWTIHDSARTAGIPAGWRVYSGVEVVGITSSRQIDLSSLIPVAWTQLSLVGGLELPGRSAWLADAPPEVSASSLAGDPVHAMLVEEAGSHDSEAADALAAEAGADREAGEGSDSGELALPATSVPPTQVLGDVDPAAIFDLRDFELDPGGYRVSLLPMDEGTALSSLRFRLLGPDSNARVSEPLAHDVWTDHFGALSAFDGGGVRGAISPAGQTIEPPQDDVALVEELPVWEAQDDDDPEDVPAPAVGSTVVTLPTCMETGAHYFKLDSAPSGRDHRHVYAVCEHCGIEKFFPMRPRGRRRRESLSRGDRLVRAAALPKLPPRPPAAEGPDFDLLLAAVSTVGCGSWRSFDRIVEQMDDRPWGSLEAARSLSALGHIDVELDRRDLKPVRWSVAPPAIVGASEDALIAGWRSDALLGAVGAVAVELGGRVVWEIADDAPTVVRITGLDHDHLELLAEEVSGRLGRSVAFVPRAAEAIAAQLPTLVELRAALHVTHAPVGVDVEHLDTLTGRWRRASSLVETGSYRASGFPRRHWHTDGSDWRAVDSRLSKWLAASSSERMLAYDSSTSAMACHLGASLPWLYERAAVLSSGAPARPSESGHLIYGQVTPIVAQALARCLLRTDGSPRAATAR